MGVGVEEAGETDQEEGAEAGEVKEAGWERTEGAARAREKAKAGSAKDKERGKNVEEERVE